MHGSRRIKRRNAKGLIENFGDVGGQGEWEARMKGGITSPAFAFFNTCKVGVIGGDRSRGGAGLGSGDALGVRRPT
jgi:hypothetical protein